MTENKRIVFNAIATYGRTALAMGMGLFSSRWVLNALGKDDYGLFGVVGGIIVFVGLLNNLLSASAARFYAYAIGEARSSDSMQCADSLQRWFNAAFSIHIILPFILTAVGYPIGIYAIKHWLVIPNGRTEACIWVYRLSLFTTFINMISAPYIAMYKAKQLIAELSLWGVVTTIANFIIAYYMLHYNGDRFIAYSVLSALAPLLILCIQVVRARRHFNACHVKMRYLFDWNRLSQIFGYAFGEFFGWVGSIVRTNGMVFAINKSFGSALNASYSIAGRVSSYAGSLSSAMLGAIGPAIVSAKGGGNDERVESLAFKSCKFGALLILVFAIPLSLEIKEVLRLWLLNPPEYTPELCVFVLLSIVISKLGIGHHMAVQSAGKIVKMQMVLGTTDAMGLLLLIIMLVLNFGPLSGGYMIVLVSVAVTIERVIFAKVMVGLPIFRWLREVVLPISTVAIIVAAIGSCVPMIMGPSFFRVICTSMICVGALAFWGWLICLNVVERRLLVKYVNGLKARVARAISK